MPARCNILCLIEALPVASPALVQVFWPKRYVICAAHCLLKSTYIAIADEKYVRLEVFREIENLFYRMF